MVASWDNDFAYDSIPGKEIIDVESPLSQHCPVDILNTDRTS